MGTVYKAFDRLTEKHIALKTLHDAKGGTSLSVPRRLGGAEGASQADSVMMEYSLSHSLPTAPGTSRIRPSSNIRSSWAPSWIASEGGVLTHLGDTKQVKLDLAREFRTLASLRHPYIVSVMDYGFDSQGAPFYTMELLDGACDILLATHTQDLPTRLKLLHQLIQAIVFLHHRGILHRDLKPANVMVVQQEGNLRIKVLDFGLSVLRSQVGFHRHEVAGTLGYLAPEVLAGGPPSEAADLFAFGMICAEVLLGRSLIQRGRAPQPPGSGIEPDVEQVLGKLPAALRDIVRQLLSDSPLPRLAAGSAARQTLADALQLPAAGERLAFCESFLPSAEFVGRSRELTVLKRAIYQARQGRGSAWLISGKSGIGKSRLLAEIRAFASVEGMLVLPGQAMQDGGAPYQLFREALRIVSLYVELTGLDASVVKAVMPELPELLGHPIADAPELGAHPAQERLLAVIESMFFRLPHPVLFLVEDVHWAGSESLEVMRRLARGIAGRQGILIASCRDDELSPQARSELAELSPLPLPPLQAEEITCLARSILGESAVRPALIHLLNQETEGTPLFIIEIIQTLAEATGGLPALSEIERLRSLVVGGMRAMLHRRLAKVPAPARQFLRLAAVAGRYLDRRVLSLMEPRFDEHVHSCASAGVLEGAGESWRFSHDNLRAQVLAELLPDELKRTHESVAAAIEAAYPDAPEYAAALAHHYAQAGNPQQSGHYLLLAGEHAVSIGAMRRGAELLELALSFDGKINISVVRRARARRLLIGALRGLGKMGDCIPVFFAACGLLGVPFPRSAVALGGALLWEVVEQTCWRLRLSRPAETAIADRERELLLLFAPMGETFAWLGRLSESVYASLAQMNRAERVGDVVHVVSQAAVLSYLLSLIPIRPLSRLYLELSRSTLQRHPRVDAEMYFHWIDGSISIGDGRLSEAVASSSRAAAQSQQLGDDFFMMFNTLMVATAHLHQGDQAKVRAYSASLSTVAARTEQSQFQAWSLFLHGVVLLREDRLEQARQRLERASELIQGTQDVLADTAVHGVLAAASLRMGDTQRAERLADYVLSLTEAQPFFTGVSYLEPLADIFSVYQSLLLRSREPSQHASLRRRARTALKLIDKFAHVFAVARARAHLVRGQWAEYVERAPNPGQHYQMSLHCAQQHHQRYEAAQAYLHLGLTETPSHPHDASTRAGYLREAAELFESLGSLQKAEIARAALAGL